MTNPFLTHMGQFLQTLREQQKHLLKEAAAHDEDTDEGAAEPFDLSSSGARPKEASAAGSGQDQPLDLRIECKKVTKEDENRNVIKMVIASHPLAEAARDQNKNFLPSAFTLPFSPVCDSSSGVGGLSPRGPVSAAAAAASAAVAAAAAAASSHPSTLKSLCSSGAIFSPQGSLQSSLAAALAHDSNQIFFRAAAAAAAAASSLRAQQNPQSQHESREQTQRIAAGSPIDSLKSKRVHKQCWQSYFRLMR
jgi:hypothetical protein